VRFRALQHKRLKDLFTSRSIEEKLVDESKERLEASIETELSAQAAIVACKAKVVAAEAKIDAAEADVTEAESEVRVVQADLTKAEVQVSFATIIAPFDGVVVHRSSVPGDFVRSANEGGSHEPLLTIHRTDVMRVVVYVPDRDVPFADPGDGVLVEIDALVGKIFPAKVSRVSRSEDAQTRSMRVEIDLPNPTGRICQGMYGKATVVLDKNADQVSIPSSCLVGNADHGVGEVYVIRDSRAQLVKVQLGIDNGLRVAVVEGLKAEDEVICQPGSDLSTGVLVTATESKDFAKANSAH
jgi:RND family efflux transporter MFP subunit